MLENFLGYRLSQIAEICCFHRVWFHYLFWESFFLLFWFDMLFSQLMHAKILYSVELIKFLIIMQETFEFLNILQVHGFPRVMGVLTHLDDFKDVKKLRRTKQRLKHRFWTEIYDGAKLFYLSGLIHGK